MKIVVENYPIDIRIDKFLKKTFPYLNQGIIERAARKGHIKINNERVKSNIRVKNGDIVTLMNYLIIETSSSSGNINLQIKEDLATQSLARKIMNNYKIAETTDYIIINKPAPLATQGGSKILLSLDDALRYLNRYNNCELKLVHRLDKDTSGTLIIAKGHASAVRLSFAFAQHLITKEYLAIVHNIPQPIEGIISTNITKIGNKVITNLSDGKSSITKYIVKAISEDQRLSLVSFTPVTGRTHQIRAHAADIGCYIVGDKKYGTLNYYDGMQPSLKLHSYKIDIADTVFGMDITYSSTLPDEFKYMLSKYFKYDTTFS